MMIDASKQVVSTAKAPKAIGPYSQAIRAGGMVWTAGQVALEPDSGELVSGDVEQQTHQVLRNLGSVLDAAGSGLALVVKTTVFLTDMQDFPKMNSVYAGYFGASPPARSTVAVTALPKGAMVEIEAVALLSQAQGD